MQCFVWKRTSQQPASYLQSAVLRDPTGCQGSIILQRAPSKQQHLILDQETLQNLDMGLGDKSHISQFQQAPRPYDYSV